MKEKKASSDESKGIKLILAALFIGAFTLTTMWLASQPTGTPIAPTNETGNQTANITKILCDNDLYCDTKETITDCPGDCIASAAIEANRSNESTLADTTPTVTVIMQDPYGIKSCGTSATDSVQWSCTVRTPGNVTSAVDCTLLNYKLDGKYMLMLRCKNMNNDDVTPVMMDDIIVCADPLGCMR